MRKIGYPMKKPDRVRYTYIIERMRSQHQFFPVKIIYYDWDDYKGTEHYLKNPNLIETHRNYEERGFMFHTVHNL